MSETNQTVGRANFEAYRVSMSNEATMTSWEQLSDSQRAHWEAAASAVEREVRAKILQKQVEASRSTPSISSAAAFLPPLPEVTPSAPETKPEAVATDAAALHEEPSK